MLVTDQATQNEDVEGAIPTAGEIGRQYKRLRTASSLSYTEDAVLVSEITVGERAISLVSMCNQAVVGNANPAGICCLT